MRACARTRGCRKSFDGEVFGVNVFCPQDKRWLDRLSKLANSQGPEALAFVSKARQDPDLVYRKSRCKLAEAFHWLASHVRK